MGPNFQNYNPRFYRRRYPKQNEVVMVVVKSIAEVGVYVSLLEYGDIEGLVLLSELSRRRIRSVNKIVKINKQEVVVVVRVDEEKTYIDLSKRRVNLEEIRLCEERYMRKKTIISIMKNVAEKLNVKDETEFEELLDRTVWTLDKTYKSSGGSYYAFKESLNDPEILNNLNITDRERYVMTLYIRDRLEPRKLKIRADIEVICYHQAGINAVKEALSEGFRDNKTEEDDNFIKINLITPPFYVVTTTTYDSVSGLEFMKEVLGRIESKIVELDGVFNIRVAPKVVSEIEDAELIKKLAELDMKDAELDAEDEEDEDEEESEDSSEDSDDEEEEDMLEDIPKVTKIENEE